MVVRDERFTDLLTMTGGPLQDTPDGVLSQVKAPCTSSDAVALGPGFEPTIDGRFIGMKTSRDTPVTTAEFSTAV
jgi:hypothetical protein